MGQSAAPPRLAVRLVAVGLLTTIVALLALDVRATYGARLSVDEPQYLLTAISLGEDLDLDISDELVEKRFLPFHEPERLNEQTMELNASGQRLSPHDPLLPALLALPMRLGGWVAARIAMALVAGGTAALTTWFAVRRLGVAPNPASFVVGAFFLSPPLIAFGNQVYPAMPSAFLVMLGLAVATGSVQRWWPLGVVAVVALPWLSVKYAPHAAVVAIGLLVGARRDRRLVGRIALSFAAMGAVYLWFHQAVYGGWTVYAAGDHFVEGGEWEVVGSAFNPWGRTRRLVGLLVDQNFGLAAWAPAFLGLPAALAWYVARRRPHWKLLLAVIGVGWAMATWIALTMHGWWWPGRQLVPIIPVAVVIIAAAVERSRRGIAALALASALSIVGWLWLVVEASTDRRALIVDFFDVGWPWYQAWRQLLPDHHGFELDQPVLTTAWAAGLIASAVVVWVRTPGAAHQVSGDPVDAPPTQVDERVHS